MHAFLFTATTYGTWLPGDPRGCVTSVRDHRPGDRVSRTRFEHDKPGQAYEPELPGLRRSARQLMSESPVWLDERQAALVLGDFRTTAAYRKCRLLAVAVMANHFHLVIGFRERRDTRRLLTDFKGYASRSLNEHAGASRTWWTRGGSRRPLRDEMSLRKAIRYVLEKQPNPLAVFDGTGETS